MGLIEKLENLINKILILIGDLFIRACLKVLPAPMVSALRKVFSFLGSILTWIKNSPALLIKSLPTLISQAKALVLGFDFKAKFAETKKAALSQYTKSQEGAKVSDLKKTMLLPFLMMGQWLKGLSITQTFVLLGFSGASVLAGISIGFSGNKILQIHAEANRAPASVEEIVQYDRPDYYKKQVRHLELTNLRLPVFFPNLNELRSVDVDFSATISNRSARMKLEKLEFQLRDHLILHVEPMVASFPMEEEGKEIMRQKLLLEINVFMIHNKIEGEVKDLKLIYILAN